VSDVVARGELLYLLTRSSLQVLDVSDPAAPRAQGALDQPAAGSLAVGGELAFVSSRTCLNPDGTGGLAVVDLSDPAGPALLGLPETPCGVLDVAAYDRYAILAAGMEGILAVDVSDPRAPFVAAQLDTPALAARVAVDGERIFALDEAAGLYLLRLEHGE
jgi:hypothetical protein